MVTPTPVQRTPHLAARQRLVRLLSPRPRARGIERDHRTWLRVQPRDPLELLREHLRRRHLPAADRLRDLHRARPAEPGHRPHLPKRLAQTLRPAPGRGRTPAEPKPPAADTVAAVRPSRPEQSIPAQTPPVPGSQHHCRHRTAAGLERQRPTIAEASPPPGSPPGTTRGMCAVALSPEDGVGRLGNRELNDDRHRPAMWHVRRTSGLRNRCEPKNNQSPRYLRYSDASSSLLWIIDALKAEKAQACWHRTRHGRSTRLTGGF
jgi:hypothetical protein